MATRKKAAKKAAKKASKKPTKKAGKKSTKKASKKPSSKKASSTKKPKLEAVPSRYGTATTHLIVSPAKEALAFYVKAFGAKDLGTMDGPGGIVMHGEMKIGDSIVMYSDEQPPRPGMPNNRKTPKNVGATTGGVMLYVPNVDKTFAQAVAAGASPTMPPMDMFWGDRYAQVDDPFGHTWAIATHIKDVTDEEMRAAMMSMGPPQS